MYGITKYGSKQTHWHLYTNHICSVCNHFSFRLHTLLSLVSLNKENSLMFCFVVIPLVP